MSQLGLEQDTVYAKRQQPINPESYPALAACVDCKRLISRKAPSCPWCGLRYMADKAQQPTVGRIAGGIIVGYLAIMAINFFAFMLFMILFAGGLASTLPR